MATPEQIHKKMAEVLDRPDFELLTHYRSDFELDRSYLDRAWHDEARMLWVIRESGTHLIPLGVHPGMSSEGLAALGSDSRNEAFIVTNKGVEPADRNRANAELANFVWLERQGRVHKNGVPVADVIDVKFEHVGNALRADVKMSSIKRVERMSLGDTVALAIHAERAAIERAGTLFCQTRSILMDGADFYAAMDAKRARWLQRERGSEAGQSRRSALGPAP